MRKKIIVLGSTGALGKATLKILKKHKEKFCVVGLSANKNEKLLKSQADEWRTKNIALSGKGEEIEIKNADIVVNVIAGIGGIANTKEAVRQNKILLLGNKESAVAEKFSIKKNNIIPLDSEHNAIFEIMSSTPNEKIKKIYLPCSGGPFYGRKSLKNITIKEATTHPKWKMGKKISVESATLINKGLEIIEAHHLFNLPLNKIKVFLHPECKIHGIVEFKKEAFAYFGPPNMEKHIENGLLRAISQKPKTTIRKIDLSKMNLSPPQHKFLRGIEIVLKAFKKNEKMIKFLTKEEETINAFLSGKIEFSQIFEDIL
jgi:1-deoxy-D-xylulose-5-phosphate reductoisomerase